MTSRTAMERLFRPDRVAFIGASAKRSTAGGNQAIRNLVSAGFRGAVDIVNPSGGDIEGIPVTTRVADLTAPDVAFVALPGTAVLETLIELEKIGCAAAVVPSSGLGANDQKAIRAFAEQASMIVHGHNCMGLINVVDRVPLWLDEGILVDVPAGNIALVAQSGSAAIFVARSAAPHGFSRIVSTGNELALDTADYLEWLAGDPETTVIGLVLESIQRPDAFREAVASCRRAGKPIVVLKVGRTDSGARATTAHTGAVVSDSAAYRALFDELDVAVAADYDELATSLQLLSDLKGRSLSGSRLGVVTISGGQAAMAADLADELGIELPALHSRVSASLLGVMPDVPANNPLDAGASVVAGPSAYLDALDLVASDPGLDAVLVLLDCQAALSDTEIAYEEEYLMAARKVAARGDRLPVLVASSSSVDLHEQSLALLEGQVPLVRGLRNALVAVAAAARNRALPEPTPRPDAVPSPPVVEELRSKLLAADVVSSDLARQVLAAYGIGYVARSPAADATEAVAAAERIGYPVVLKVDSPDLPHRSDVGGVRIGIRDADQLTAAAEEMRRAIALVRPEAAISGFEVQEQVDTTVEAFAGFVSDPVLGPTLAFGSGGVLVELLGDTIASTCPVGPDKVGALLEQTVLGRRLRGYRGLLPDTELTPVSELVSRLSWLAADLGDVISEVDLNPVLIEPGSGLVRIVDALLVRGADR